MKWKLDLPYMTKAERATFKRMRSKGEITVHRTRMCQGILNMDADTVTPAAPCEEEIPLVDGDDGQPAKRYCSQKCYVRTEEPVDESTEEDEDESA